MLPTPARLVADVVACWRDYGELGVSRRRRVAFCGLRVGQRVAYWAGWVAGSRRMRGLTP